MVTRPGANKLPGGFLFCSLWCAVRDVHMTILRHEAEIFVSFSPHFLLHDPLVSKARKMLTIEQFRNAQMAELQTKQNYTNVMNYFTNLMRFFIRNGKLKDCDAEVMAAQLCLPVSVWLNLCDREPEREDEVITLIGRHIRQFFEMYKEQ